MSFLLESVRARPVGLWILDSASPFSDASGYGRTGTATGTPGKHLSLVTGAAYASVFSSSSVGTFASPVFKQGAESQAFTLGAAFKVIRANGEQQVLGNPSRSDGILVNGTTIIFTTKYSTTGEARVEYDLEVPRAVVVYGVHTVDKNSLYIDGELVAEANITDEQRNDTLVATSANLSSGQTSGTGAIAVNGISVYARALNGTEIASLSETAKNFGSFGYRAFDGTEINFSTNFTNVFASKTWETEDQWRQGTLSNVTVENDELIATMINGVPMSGEWLDSFAMDSGITSIYGVYLDWDGESAVVETSMDGTNWEAVVRGKKISSITEGFNPTNKQLQIRISFDGDDGFVSRLTVTGLASGTVSYLNSRSITYTGATTRLDTNPFELNELWGARLDGGTITISADPAGTPFRTVDIWMKQSTSLTTNLDSANNIYSNGGSSFTLPVDEWQVRTYVFNTDQTGTITLSGTGLVGKIVIYPTTLTAQQVAQVYNSDVRRNLAQATDNSVIGVTEPATATDIYARDWAISISAWPFLYKICH